MENIVLSIEVLTDVAMFAIGIMLCFWGYKAFKATITCAGIVIGYQIGAFFERWIEAFMDKQLDDPFPIVLRIVFAIVLGILAFKFYKKGIIVVVTYFVAKSAYSIIATAVPQKVAVTKDNLVVLGICIVIGLVVGILSIYVQKWIIIILSSIGGSMLIAELASKYLYNLNLIKDGASVVVSKLFKAQVNSATAFAGLLVLILCIFGIVIQAKNTKSI